MAEIVYILTNEAMTGLVKIGKTTSDLASRIQQLFTTGVPLPFSLFYACEVKDAKFVEDALHEAFDDHRVSKRREFFRIAPERVKAALSIGALKDVSLTDNEVFETPEDKEDVEVAKRRSRFRLSMIAILPGTTLQLAKDTSVTCVTHDDINKVMFKGQVCSLSDAANQAFHDLGIVWPSISGPWEWSYQGKRLDEIRREIEEAD